MFEKKSLFTISVVVEGILCDDFIITAALKKNSASDKYPIPDWLEQIKNRSYYEGLQNQSAVFNGKYSPEFIGMITRFSYGMAFNMVPSDQLFNDEVAEIFIGTEKIRLRGFDENLSLINLNQSDYPVNGSTGLSFHFDPHPEEMWIWENFLCKPMRFLVHSPYEIPGSYEEIDYCHFYHGNDLEVLITPVIVKSDESLRSYPAEIRKCYFEDERKLRYFKKYTKKNCQAECFSNFTIQNNFTKCLEFHQIRSRDDDVCDYRYYDRLKKALYVYQINDLEKDCSCMEACNYIEYSIEIISSKLEAETTEE
jgi:Amiloride-sensitive sodium channel